MIRFDNEQRLDTEYVATVLWSIGKMLNPDQYTIPSYAELRHPKPKDNRDSATILVGLKEKLMKGGVA